MSRRVNRWLLLDVNYLAYRAFHSTGNLQHRDNPTGVIFGVLSEALRVMERFQTKLVCWCFDYGQPLRAQLLPQYKSGRKKNRREKTEEELLAYEAMKCQLELMRTVLLREIGFRNVFSEQGYEADDIIAKISQELPVPHESIVVSSDQDLYQLISPTSMNWNPHKQQLRTEKSFIEEFGITPKDWIKVKAIAGCSSDNIPGIPGVGEKTAIKYLRGVLNPKTVTYKRIHDEVEKNGDVFSENEYLVELPFEDCPSFRRKVDKVTLKNWRSVMKRLGFKSLYNNAPVKGSFLYGN